MVVCKAKNRYFRTLNAIHFTMIKPFSGERMGKLINYGIKINLLNLLLKSMYQIY